MGISTQIKHKQISNKHNKSRETTIDTNKHQHKYYKKNLEKKHKLNQNWP